MNCKRPDIPAQAGIYRITNTITNKFYIGSAVSLRNRIAVHLSNLRKGIHVNRHLQRAWNTNKEENFTFEVIAKCPKEYTIRLEQWFIDNLKPTYNNLKVAGSKLGSKLSEESKKKLSATDKQRWRDNYTYLAECQKKKCVPILCYDKNDNFLKEFIGIKYAALELNLPLHYVKNSLFNNLKGKRGYYFRYKNKVII